MTSFAIKLIAILAMTVDHTAAIFGQEGLMSLFPSLTLTCSYHIINIMRGVGRIAFPLFAFQVAQSSRKTHSMTKYIGRLALLAVLTEPIFYASLSLEAATVQGFLKNLLGFNLNNVFFTFTLAVSVIYIYQLLEAKKHRWILFIPAFAAGIFLCGYIGSDYGMPGILLVVLMYLSKTKLHTCIVITVWSICVYLAPGLLLYNVVDCLCAILSCVLICIYNGERGKSFKWFFYIYYPTHLLILSLLRGVIS